MYWRDRLSMARPGEAASYKSGLIAAGSQGVLVNRQRLPEQGFSGGGLPGIIHKHPEIRNIGSGFRTVRPEQGRVDADRAAVE